MFESRLSREDEDRCRRRCPFFNVDNHAPEPEVKKARQITTSESHAGKWMLVEPREIEKPILKIDEILYREANPYLNFAKASTKDAEVQTDPDTAKDFSWNIPRLKNSAEKLDAWKHPASKDATVVPVRITNVKRRRLNKEYSWIDLAPHFSKILEI